MRTSLTHPLQINEVSAPGGGVVGITFCPGKHQSDAASGAWAQVRGGIHGLLDRGGRVLVHCKGGLGRAGTVAALILVERGMTADAALKAVRAVRPGAVETMAQEDYVRLQAALER